jgi:hypothetical protein
VLLSVPVTVTCVALSAVTINVEELPTAIEVGLATMVIVGAAAAATVTVALAEAEPPPPVAVAVYVVVALGLTDCVPPPGCKVKVLPSDPATVS